jgi:phosphate transport system protein
MITQSITALKNRDEKLIAEVFAKETTINQYQIDIDDYAFKLIALHQPAASDLRFIISAIKINSDLERIGDLAINIIERTQDLLKEPPLKPLIDIPRMADLSQEMLNNAIKAFITRDSGLAKKVCLNDDTVDELNEQIFRELLTYMLQDPKNINRAVDLMLIARHLERIADHATNISEDVLYITEGKDIRHHAEDGQ